MAHTLQEHQDKAFDLMLERREKVVKQIAKEYIIENYGKDSWPQLFACVSINKSRYDRGTTYVFNKVTEVDDKIEHEQIPLVRVNFKVGCDTANLTTTINLFEEFKILCNGN
jgi:hypothetical protein